MWISLYVLNITWLNIRQEHLHSPPIQKIFVELSRCTFSSVSNTFMGFLFCGKKMWTSVSVALMWLVWHSSETNSSLTLRTKMAKGYNILLAGTALFTFSILIWVDEFLVVVSENDCFLMRKKETEKRLWKDWSELIQNGGSNCHASSWTYRLHPILL